MRIHRSSKISHIRSSVFSQFKILATWWLPRGYLVLVLTNYLVITHNLFTRVKFYLSGSGRSPVEEFLQELSKNLPSDLFDAVSRLSEGETLGMPLSRNLSSIAGGLHELRLEDRSGQVRFFYFIKRGDAIYMLHAFKKKTQEIPGREIDMIRKRIKEI